MPRIVLCASNPEIRLLFFCFIIQTRNQTLAEVRAFIQFIETFIGEKAKRNFPQAVIQRMDETFAARVFYLNQIRIGQKRSINLKKASEQTTNLNFFSPREETGGEGIEDGEF